MHQWLLIKLYFYRVNNIIIDWWLLIIYGIWVNIVLLLPFTIIILKYYDNLNIKWINIILYNIIGNL